MEATAPISGAISRPAPAAAAQARVRLDSIELVRGLVMILMVLDHTRDFVGTSAMNPRDVHEPVLFLTHHARAQPVSLHSRPVPRRSRDAAGFITLRLTSSYGDPAPWAPEDGVLPTVLSFINCENYPPSLLYLAMTLGRRWCSSPTPTAYAARRRRSW